VRQRTKRSGGAQSKLISPAMELLELAAGELLPSLALEALLRAFVKPSAGSSLTAPRISSHIPGRVRLWVEGVRGDRAHARSVQRALARLPGVRHAAASPLTGTALVHYDPSSTSPSEICRALTPNGLAMRVVRQDH